MGKITFAFLVAVCATVSCAAAEDAINPMAWSKDQWRSDLFDTYPQHRAPHHSAKVRRIVVEHVVESSDNPTDVQQQATASRPRLIVIGDHGGTSTRVQSAPGAARHCGGVLILTWRGDHATSQCLGGSRRQVPGGS
ncbi:MAG: hypothetical protein ABL973_17890 [Micropepsaceae bacterium]